MRRVASHEALAEQALPASENLQPIAFCDWQASRQQRQCKITELSAAQTLTIRFV